MHSIIVILAMLPAIAFLIRSAQKDSGELAAVLDRAGQYVTRYLDDELGDVGAAETYSPGFAVDVKSEIASPKP